MNRIDRIARNRPINRLFVGRGRHRNISLVRKCRFTSTAGCVNGLGLMLKCFRSLLGVVLLSIGSVGCTTTSITNLTPGDFPRSNSGLYRVEAAWNSNQKSIQQDTVQPMVIIGGTQYPMQPVPFADSRWETMVPVAATEDVIHYQFKFNYTYHAIPQPLSNSKRSPEFRLDITPEG
jgi:hypothetical protein